MSDSLTALFWVHTLILTLSFYHLKGTFELVPYLTVRRHRKGMIAVFSRPGVRAEPAGLFPIAFPWSHRQAPSWPFFPSIREIGNHLLIALAIWNVGGKKQREAGQQQEEAKIDSQVENGFKNLYKVPWELYSLPPWPNFVLEQCMTLRIPPAPWR